MIFFQLNLRCNHCLEFHEKVEKEKKPRQRKPKVTDTPVLTPKANNKEKPITKTVEKQVEKPVEKQSEKRNKRYNCLMQCVISKDTNF